MVVYQSFRELTCSRLSLTPLQVFLGYVFVWLCVFIVFKFVQVLSPAADHLAWLAAFSVGDYGFFGFALAYHAFYLLPYLALGAGIAVSMLMILRSQKTTPSKS